MSGETVYAYVYGNPISYTDPSGLFGLVTLNAFSRNPIPTEDAIRMSNNMSAVEVAGTGVAASPVAAALVGGALYPAAAEAGGMMCEAVNAKNLRGAFSALRMFEKLYGSPEIAAEAEEMGVELRLQKLIPGQNGFAAPAPPPAPTPPFIGGP